jgi:hypothetical protein
MKTTFTVPEVVGSKRSTERIYTHAVIGKRNWKHHLECVLFGVKQGWYKSADSAIEKANIPVSEIPFEVLQWSQSYNNAVKGLSNSIFKNNYINLLVVTVTPINK